MSITTIYDIHVELLQYIFKYIPRYHRILYEVNHNYQSIVCSMNNGRPKHYITAIVDTIPLFEWIIEHDIPKYNLNICRIIAYNGNCEVLKYAINESFAHDLDMYLIAIESGNLEIIKYIHETKMYRLYDWYYDNAARFGHLNVLQYFIEQKCPISKEITIYATLGNHLNIIKYMNDIMPNDFNNITNADMCTIAALMGHFDLLKWLHQNNYCWNENTCCAAALGGHLEILKYLHENGCQWDNLTCFSDLEYPILPKSEIPAAGILSFDFLYKGRKYCADNYYLKLLKNDFYYKDAENIKLFDVLKYAHENDCPWNISTLFNLIHIDDIKILEYLYDNGIQNYKCDYNNLLISMVEFNCIKSIKWFFNNNILQLGDYTICYKIAARCNDIEILKFLHENNVPWHKKTCTSAISYDYVKYVIDNGFPWDEKILINAIKRGCLETIKYHYETNNHQHIYSDELTRHAAKTSNIPILEYLRSKQCPWNENSYEQAVKKNNMELVKYLDENGCPCDNNICTIAAMRGNFEILKYLHNKGHMLDEETFLEAALGDYIEIVKYLYDNNCPYHDDICNLVSDRIKMLKYLHSKNFPWNKSAYINVINKQNIKIIKYLHRHGCPWDESVFICAVENSNIKIIKYLLENGCPINIINNIDIYSRAIRDNKVLNYLSDKLSIDIQLHMLVQVDTLE